MSRMRLARRYGPLLAVAAVQLLIIAVVPSTAQKGSTEVGFEEDVDPSTEAAPVGVVDPETGQLIDPATGRVLDPATGRPVGAAGTEGGGTEGGGAGGGSSGGVGGVGDTSHCVNGRQFDPALYEWAPPCVPKFTGNNGGVPRGTRGVTKDTIRVVAMLGNYGAAVQEILERQGSPSFEQFSRFAEAAEKFLNAKYELYGRKIDIIPYQFKAVTGGGEAPNDSVLRNEVRQVVQQYNPFAVTWANSVSSATYDELSRLKVVNLGGYGFTDNFNTARRPYHWDVQMGGYELAEAVSSWYCTRMHGGGTAKAVYARSTPLPRGFALQDKVRNLGIITTNDKQNLDTVTRVKALLKSKCGVNVTHQYNYAQDIRTLEQQRIEAYNQMTTAKPEATTIMCFCDQVAPTFLYKTCDDNEYFPEMVIVATGVMDLDRAAQAYDHGAEYPERTNGRGTRSDDGIYDVFENAFGLAQFPRQGPFSTSTASKVWKAAGGTGDPEYTSTDEEFNYYAMLAGMIQMAGAKLTPFTLETGATRLGALGGTGHERTTQRSLGAGNYTWNDSLREVYWSPMTPSPFNGIKGTYKSLNGGKSFVGSQFPSGLLTLPDKPR